jgi:hypothetical protein
LYISYRLSSKGRWNSEILYFSSQPKRLPSFCQGGRRAKQRDPYLRQLDYPHFLGSWSQNSSDLIPRSKGHQGTYKWMKILIM